MVSPNRYINLEQLRYWAGEPIMRWRTVGDAGDMSHRYLRVAPMNLFILTVQGGYEDDIATPFSDRDRAVEAAVQLMSEPDRRGLERTWERDEGQPRPYKLTGRAYGWPVREDH